MTASNKTGDASSMVAEQRRAWAWRQLGLPSDSPLDQITPHMLRSLRQANYLPDKSLVAAWKELVPTIHAPHADDQGFAESEVSRLMDRVRQFGQSMFELPIPERRRQWLALLRECGSDDRPSMFLTALRPGLDVEWSELDKATPDIQQLGRYCGELFVLPRRERAMRRAEILQQLTASPVELMLLRGKLEQFQTIFHSVAKLEPTLLASLYCWKLSVTSLAVRPPPAVPRVVLKQDWSRSSHRWLVYLGCFVLGIVLAAFRYGSTGSTSVPKSKTHPIVHTKKELDLLIDGIKKQRLEDLSKRESQERPDPNVEEDRRMNKMLDELKKRLREQPPGKPRANPLLPNESRDGSPNKPTLFPQP
jgi:hypothetical protein